MIAWRAWQATVGPLVPGCPWPTIEHNLRLSARDFFERTRAWQMMLDPIAVSSGDSVIDIDLDQPTEQSIVRVERAWYDGRALSLLSLSDIERQSSTLWTAETGTPNSLVQHDPGHGHLHPIPDTDAVTGLVVRVGLMPAMTSTGIPDQFGGYVDLIGHGAVARLCMYPGVEWTNVDRATTSMAIYNAGVSKAVMHVATGLGGSPIRSRPSWC